MSIEEDLIRIKAFKKELDTLNDKYQLSKPISEYYDLAHRPDKIQRKFGFYFKENIDLSPEVREDCINIFKKFFPGEEGVHGRVWT